MSYEWHYWIKLLVVDHDLTKINLLQWCEECKTALDIETGYDVKLNELDNLT